MFGKILKTIGGLAGGFIGGEAAQISQVGYDNSDPLISAVVGVIVAVLVLLRQLGILKLPKKSNP